MSFKQDNYLTLFSELSVAEQIRFSKDIPHLFREDSLHRRLFDLIKEMQDPLKFDKEQVRRAFFPEVDRKKALQKLSALLSDLNQQLKQFLLQLHLEKLTIERELTLHDIMVERKQKMAAESHLKAALNMLADAPLSIERHLLSLQIHMQNYFSPYTDKSKDGAAKIQQMSDAVDELYHSFKLKLAIEALSRGEVLREFSILGSTQLEKLLDANIYQGAELTQIYRNIYILFSKQKAPTQKILDQLFSSNVNKLEKTEQAYCLNLLLTINAQRIKRGKEGAYQTQYELYQIGLETSILTPDDFLSAERFLNFINTACESGKIDEAKTFMDRWVKQVTPDIYREEVEFLAKARIEFAGGNYENVQDLLQVFKPTHLFGEIWTRSLLVRNAYMLDDADKTIDYCNSFGRYLGLHNNEKSEIQKKKKVGVETERSLRSFLNTMKQLANYLHYKKIPVEFKERVENEEMAYKQWVMAQILKKS